MKILISACLLGVSCRYDQSGKLQKNIEDLKEKHQLIPVCPEMLGGLSTPRLPSEIRNNKVYDQNGKDVTKEFEQGAAESLYLAKFFGCTHAILKERSPSCGYGEIYDGSFSKKLIEGNGITAGLLSENGVIVIGESQLDLLL